MSTKKIIMNLFIIIALAAVMVMVVLIFLYDYIPSSTIQEAPTYETSSEVTKIFTEIADTTAAIAESSTSGTSTSSSGTTSTIVLKTYSISETDLALYSASGDYDKGKADPFAEADSGETEASNGETTTSSESGNTTTSSSSNSSSSNSSSSSSSSDGTLFNSTKTK